MRQRCILSHVLFAVVIGWTTKNALSGLDVGLQCINDGHLFDLDYADIILLGTSHEGCK